MWYSWQENSQGAGNMPFSPQGSSNYHETELAGGSVLLTRKEWKTRLSCNCAGMACSQNITRSEGTTL